MVGLVDGGAARAVGRLGPGETASGGGGGEADHVRRLHRHAPADHQCTSTLVKHIKAPVHLVSFPFLLLIPLLASYVSGIASLHGSGVPCSIPDALVSDRCVWELVRSFDQPQRYKPFVSRCIVRGDQLEIGSLREVNVKTGLPATTSTERLEQLDDDEHILGVKFVGGDHRLQNYSSIITVHPESIDGRPGTLVIESFVVDVPDGNTKDETCYFVEAVIKCNLTSLAEVSERLAVQSPTSPLEH
ncbi:hypothetical protein HU200_020075 [Digitaria exilis]|uniref:Uncharacterized protein n=1 Tax=Digitaria exilis TaxID=1010633 RepID=A0A835F1E8_9POAL|nr:hypothetical protein HU200_020075 [Digitaria exilis]CAB3463514.1 unnamed protein product [Digitaria exilis]